MLFVETSTQVMGLMAGALIIAVMGAVDDIVTLNAWVKLAVQVLAAFVAVQCGVVFDVISTPIIISETKMLQVGFLAVPATILWIISGLAAVRLLRLCRKRNADCGAAVLRFTSA